METKNRFGAFEDFDQALARVQQVLDAHDKKKGSTWRHATFIDHAEHALGHLKNVCAAEMPRGANHDEVELAHAACRAIMALEVYMRMNRGSVVPCGLPSEV